MLLLLRLLLANERLLFISDSVRGVQDDSRGHRADPVDLLACRERAVPEGSDGDLEGEEVPEGGCQGAGGQAGMGIRPRLHPGDEDAPQNGDLRLRALLQVGAVHDGQLRHRGGGEGPLLQARLTLLCFFRVSDGGEGEGNGDYY